MNLYGVCEQVLRYFKDDELRAMALLSYYCLEFLLLLLPTCKMSLLDLLFFMIFESYALYLSLFGVDLDIEPCTGLLEFEEQIFISRQFALQINPS